MKPLFTLVFLFIAFQSQSQTDWWCVLPGVKNYYTNSNHYLRGTRIDSVKTIGNATVLYPFKSPRGYYLNFQKLKPSGSWVGENITILPDGTHFFDNFWGDTVIIKTQAALNDSWILFDDTTDIYYTATLSTVDTMTVLGVVDSIKEITIHAFNSGGTFTTDPLHNAKLIFSKSHGFVQAVDMFTFPFHEPGKTYKKGFDYFLDKMISWPPFIDDITFQLTEFINPQMREVYNFDVGDILQHKVDGVLYTPNSAQSSLILDEISAKQNLGSDLVEYTINRWVYTQKYAPPSHSTVPSIITVTYGSNRLIDTSRLPEEVGQNLFYHYNINDSSFCYRSTLFEKRSNFISLNGVNTFEPCGENYQFKIGMGEFSHDQCWDATSAYYKYIVWAKKNGKACGSYIPLEVQDAISHKVCVYPNPASDILTIELPSTTTPQTITLCNSLGVLVREARANQKITLTVSDLPAGIYFLNIQSESGSSIREKIIIHR